MHKTGDGPVLATWLYATTRLHGVVKEVGGARTLPPLDAHGQCPARPTSPHRHVPTADGLRTEAGYVIVLHAGSDGSRISISGNASVGKGGIGQTGKDTLLAFLKSQELPHHCQVGALPGTQAHTHKRLYSKPPPPARICHAHARVCVCVCVCVCACTCVCTPPLILRPRGR